MMTRRESDTFQLAGDGLGIEFTIITARKRESRRTSRPLKNLRDWRYFRYDWICPTALGQSLPWPWLVASLVLCVRTPVLPMIQSNVRIEKTSCQQNGRLPQLACAASMCPSRIMTCYAMCDSTANPVSSLR